MTEEGHGLSNKDARERGQSPVPQLVTNAQLEIEVRVPRQHGHDRLLESPADPESLLPSPRPRSPPKETLFDRGRSDAHLRQIPGIVVELLPEAAPEPVRPAAHSGHLMGGSSQVPKALRPAGDIQASRGSSLQVEDSELRRPLHSAQVHEVTRERKPRQRVEV